MTFDDPAPNSFARPIVEHDKIIISQCSSHVQQPFSSEGAVAV